MKLKPHTFADLAFRHVAMMVALAAVIAPPFPRAAHAAAAADATAASWGETIPTAKPEEVGLSSERLARIGTVMKRYVEQGNIVGAIGAVARHGKLAYLETWGMRDRAANAPMKDDAIFRIFSMTKAITGVAIMMLYEEQGFPLNTPASRWIPELHGMQVAVEGVDPKTGERTYRLEPTKRDITVHDLLTHSSGISYDGPLDARGESTYKKLGIDPSPADMTLADLIGRIAKAPLHDQPGTVWRYSLSIDVLARLVEVISGQPFDEFLSQRIFQPLHMRDTAFFVPPEKKDRLTAIYQPVADGKLIDHPNPPRSFLAKPKLLSGGGGLTSTTRDYLRFAQMLLDGGELGGRRILSRKTVELMSSDAIGDQPRKGGSLGPGDGFGLTFRVNLNPGRNGALGSPGEFSWGGTAGTRFWIDPKEDMVTVFMIQIHPHEGLTYGSEFKTLAYQSIAD